MSQLQPPRFEIGPELLLGGLSQRYSAQTMSSIPAQWQRFVPFMGRIPGQIGTKSYGVLHNADAAGNADYLCGVEVASVEGLPSGLTHLRIPQHRYAVFAFRDHISTIGNAWAGIFQWICDPANHAALAPRFEMYDQRYDPATGNGGCEIWIPVEG